METEPLTSMRWRCFSLHGGVPPPLIRVGKAGCRWWGTWPCSRITGRNILVQEPSGSNSRWHCHECQCRSILQCRRSVSACSHHHHLQQVDTKSGCGRRFCCSHCQLDRHPLCGWHSWAAHENGLQIFCVRHCIFFKKNEIVPGLCDCTRPL